MVRTTGIVPRNPSTSPYFGTPGDPVSVPVKKNISCAGLVDSGPVGGEAVQKLYNSFYMR
jgi:hypothetical protein